MEGSEVSILHSACITAGSARAFTGDAERQRKIKMHFYLGEFGGFERIDIE